MRHGRTCRREHGAYTRLELGCAGQAPCALVVLGAVGGVWCVVCGVWCVVVGCSVGGVRALWVVFKGWRNRKTHSEWTRSQNLLVARFCGEKSGSLDSFFDGPPLKLDLTAGRCGELLCAA